METKNQQNGSTQTDNSSDNLAEALINTDESAAGTTHLNDEVAEESAFEKLQASLDDQKDKYLRLFAEFDNYKRRTAKERLELIQTASKDLVTDLLGVLDDFERAEKVMDNGADIAIVIEGQKLVMQKLKNLLEQKGLKAMESIGQAFNADLHEAITEIPAPTDEMVGKVIDEVQKGYLLKDKIIRYAKVVVGK